MESLKPRLDQYRGAPGQGNIVKAALMTHHSEIAAILLQNARLVKRVEELEQAIKVDDEPIAVCAAPAIEKEDCPLVPIIVPLVAAGVVAAAAVLTKPEPVVTSKPQEAAEPVGHFSVGVEAAAVGAPGVGNALPIPVPSPDNTEEGSNSDEVERILLEAEQHSADRYMSLAKHQQQTTEKVRAAAARKRRAAVRLKPTV